ncbi:MAG: tetratricopeptide repeat protein [Anaerolineae bacterium]|nr:tetratricopeptide repeat protein [Gloeobacterales cyanobacterium ES-bin-313]
MSQPKKNKVLLIGIAIFGFFGFVGPLLFTLFSIFTGGEQATPPPTPVANEAIDPKALKVQIDGYQTVLKREPNNLNALGSLAELYLRSGQYAQAVPLVEKVSALQPDNLQITQQLVALYVQTKQFEKIPATYARSEASYDQLLAKDKNNLNGLVGKARLRQIQGDLKTARTLLDQAVKVAPADLKPQVKKLSEQMLAPPATAASTPK